MNPIGPPKYHPNKPIQIIVLIIKIPATSKPSVFYERLTAKENLDFHCEYVGYHDKRAVDEALEIVGLKEVANKKIHEFSLGMKQRLGIARAIVTKPEILILDEPINGLDPIGIKDIRELLLLLKEEYGITILISSHIVSEIESIADTIGIINQGKLLKEVKMEEIRKENVEYLEIEVDSLKKTTQVLEDKLGMKKYEIVDKNTIRIFEQALSLKDSSLKELTVASTAGDNYISNVTSPKMKVTSTDGEVAIKNATEGKSLFVETKSGDIAVSYIEAPTSLMLTANSLSSDIIVNLDRLKKKRDTEKSKEGTIGDASNKLEVLSKEGTIKIN